MSSFPIEQVGHRDAILSIDLFIRCKPEKNTFARFLSKQNLQAVESREQN